MNRERPCGATGEAHPRHVCDVPEGQRGRTYRTYRTYRTAASPEDSPQKPKRGVRSPPCPYRPPGRTCALRARTARPLRRALCTFVVRRALSRGRFGPLGLHGNSRAASGLPELPSFQSACGSTPLIGFNLRNRRFLLRCARKAPQRRFDTLIGAGYNKCIYVLCRIM